MELATGLALAALLAVAAVGAVIALPGDDRAVRAAVAPTAAEPREADGGLPALAATEVRALAPKPIRLEESVEAVSDGASSVWRTPAGDGGVCLSRVGADGATVSCVPEEAIESNSAPPSSATLGCRAERRPSPGGEGEAFDVDLDCGDGEAIIYGVVSVAVDRVAVVLADGSAQPARLADGVYLATVPIESEPVAVRITGERIDERTPVRLPGRGG